MIKNQNQNPTTQNKNTKKEPTLQQNHQPNHSFPTFNLHYHNCIVLFCHQNKYKACYTSGQYSHPSEVVLQLLTAKHRPSAFSHYFASNIFIES